MNSRSMNEQSVNSEYCTFRVGEVFCGVRVDDVREIVSDLTVTPVPLASEMIAGVINLRGQILTVVDMCRWLQLGETPADLCSRFHLLADIGNEFVSLWVDEMGPVIRPVDEEIERVPGHLDPSVASRVEAVARMEEQIVLLLRLEELKELRAKAMSAT